MKESMIKEIIIIIVIIIVIVGLNYYTQTYLEKTSDDLTEKLIDLKKGIEIVKQTNDTEKIKEQSEEIKEQWDKQENTWSLLIKHEELDLIQISILKVKAGIENNALADSLLEIDQSIFLIGHIKEKDSFQLKNIF